MGAHAVRLATIDNFNDAAKGDKEDWVAKLRDDIAKCTPEGAKPNSFETVFDITGVRAGSLRMPYCEKVVRSDPRKAYEGRPILPVGELHFHFPRGDVEGTRSSDVCIQWAAVPPGPLPDSVKDAIVTAHKNT